MNLTRAAAHYFGEWENARPSFREFLDKFYRSNNMMKEHVLYQYMLDESHQATRGELCMIIHMMTDHWNTFVDSRRKENMIAISDTWVEAWLTSPRVIRSFYQGKNPTIQNSIRIMD